MEENLYIQDIKHALKTFLVEELHSDLRELRDFIFDVIRAYTARKRIENYGKEYQCYYKKLLYSPGNQDEEEECFYNSLVNNEYASSLHSLIVDFLSLDDEILEKFNKRNEEEYIESNCSNEIDWFVAKILWQCAWKQKEDRKRFK